MSFFHVRFEGWQIGDFKILIDFQRIKSWNPVSNQSEIILNTGEFGTAFSKTSVIAATPEHVFVGGFSGEVVMVMEMEMEIENENIIKRKL